MNKEEHLQVVRDMVQEYLDEIESSLEERKILKASRDLETLRDCIAELEQSLGLE